MLFNSVDFAIFLPVVFILYWLVINKNLKFQNLLIVVASYVFYGWWDWKFLSLIIFSTLVDYSIGLKLKKEENHQKRKTLLWISVIVNLGFLGFFKYFNFFLDNFITAFSFFGSEINTNSLNIILPVGISFYTFQTLSYTIDVYNRKLEPTNDIIAFAAFVSFFPQLVAGPIERATNLLPQFNTKRQFEYSNAVDGIRQIFWGLFKKLVIADNCAEYANMIFDHSADHSGSTLVLGAVCFAFQIYGDFSGYSDIAIGTSRLFGFDLKQNFAFPYFSRDIAEFWRRWHISLSSWFKDYLYIPLGGSREGTAKVVRNTFVIFIVSGFWHGANWTFIAWGILNAIYFLPLLLLGKNRKHLDVVAVEKNFPNLKEVLSMTTTFMMTVFAWIFFRAESIGHAFSYIKAMFQGLILKESYIKTAAFLIDNSSFMFLVLMLFFIIIEWVGRTKKHALMFLENQKNSIIRSAIYFVMFVAILTFRGGNQEFIYFQF